MKIAISYPPFDSPKGTPLLTQNRQFQWFSSPTYIYPVIPASAATLLAREGFEVFWDDAIAEGLSYDEWLVRLEKEKPDIIVIETKTPVIKKHWQIINELKNLISPPLEKGELKGDLKNKTYAINPSQALPLLKGDELRWNPKFVLMGDHITAFPEESFINSQVDYVIAGGDYDFLLLNLVKNLRNLKNTPGVWSREGEKIICGGKYNPENNSLENLPLIDRDLTHWKLYAFQNGNFKNTPGAYLMSGRDCWWGKCSFCSWTTLFPANCYRTQSAKKALLEVKNLIKLGVKEIMEDSGTLPVGSWLEEFCHGMIEGGFNQKVTVNCNMRLNAIKDEKTWQLMKKSGFRMILFGLESANQNTLNKLNKGLKVEEIEPSLKACSRAGLEPHITVMLGYPWETKKDIERTLEFVKKLFRNNLVSSLQTTLMVPYPGTPLYKYCQENNLLLTDNYDRYDQREQVMKTEITDEEIKKMIRRFYRSFFSPKFIGKKLMSLKSKEDLKFILKSGGKLIGHLKDFSSK
jgi:anaerobic magnesium-protoporphyrin IX monomethyl ester cyclase